MDHRLLEAGRRHQLARARRGASITMRTRVPASRASLSQRVNSGMCRQTSMSAALISASSVPLHSPDRRDADLGPGRHGVDAHLVDVGAELLGRREGRLHVVAARAEIAEQRRCVSPFWTLQSSNSWRNSIASLAWFKASCIAASPLPFAPWRSVKADGKGVMGLRNRSRRHGRPRAPGERRRHCGFHPIFHC